MDIHRQIVDCIESGHPFAVAVVLATDGSTPQGTGAKAILDGTGRIWGTIGGGPVEAEAQRRAIQACASQRPIVFQVSLDAASAKDDAPICGGAMRILIDPTAGKARAAFARAADALERRQRGVLLTSVRAATPPEIAVHWFAEDALPSETGFPDAEAIRSCLAREAPRLLVEGGMEVLVEPVIPRPVLLIVGGGHVGQALARQAVALGFEVTVVDDRPEFADPARFPDGVTTRCGDIPTEVAGFPITGDTFVVVVTRGHRHDAEALAACIHAPAAYIGMIGSRRKVGLMREEFIASGLATEEEFGRVFAPVGLDIGAVTVPEIATSIAAQLVAVRRKGRAVTHPADMVLR